MSKSKTQYLSLPSDVTGTIEVVVPGKKFKVFAPYEDQSGKRRYKTKTIKGFAETAIAKLREYNEMAESGTLGAKTREKTTDTILQQGYRWADARKHSVSETTHGNHIECIEDRIAPYWGDTPICDITRADYDKYLQWLFENYTGDTPKNTHTYAKSILVRAAKLGLMEDIFDTSKYDKISFPKKDRAKSLDMADVDLSELDDEEIEEIMAGHGNGKIRYLTEEQLGAVYKALPEYFRAFEMATKLAAEAGPRPGEVLACNYRKTPGLHNYIDWDTGELVIRGAIKSKRGREVIGPPKTEAGTRRVPLSAGLLAELKTYHAWVEQEFAGKNKTMALFPNTTGKRMGLHDWRKSVNRIIRAAGIKAKHSPYDFRHTFATLHLLNGTNAKVIQEMMGHEDVETTLNTYTWVLPESREQAAEVMEAIRSRMAA